MKDSCAQTGEQSNGIHEEKNDVLIGRQRNQDIDVDLIKRLLEESDIREMQMIIF